MNRQVAPGAGNSIKPSSGAATNSEFVANKSVQLNSHFAAENSASQIIHI